VREEPPPPNVHFFFVGTGSSITLSTIALGSSYFAPDVGASVLANIGIAQFTTSLFAMGVLLICRSKQLSVPTMQTLMHTGLSYALLVNVVVAFLAYTQFTTTTLTISCLVAGNGLCTGIIQGIGSLLAGIFTQYSLHHGASGAMLAGAGCGVAIPTVIQLLLLPLAIHSKTREQAHDYAAVALMITSAAASLLILVAILASQRIFAHPVCLRLRDDPFGLEQVA
jgi:hypothetical protein